MEQIKEGTLLWKPNDTQIEQTNIYQYMTWLNEHKQLYFNNYHSLWKWSVNDIEAFWESLWDYFDIQAKQDYKTILTSRNMPGAIWFKEATLNYTEHIFKERKRDDLAIIHSSETRETTAITWEQLYNETAAMQQTLKRLGIKKGDRVVAYVANIFEAVVAFLATASLGAIWSSASPDFGTKSVIDRFKQIEPKVMITVDGYSYSGREFDRMSIIESIQDELPTLEATIVIPYLNNKPNTTALKNVTLWKDAIQTNKKRQLTYEYVPFNDPLWILFSSGTTGKPKPIVHSQGGILLEHLKALTFHSDLDKNDRFFWFTTTGWMMWNYLVGALLTGSTIILYDGNPTFPDRNMLWKHAEQTKMTVFGTSASFITDAMNNKITPRKRFDLSSLRNISSTGSPLPPEGFNWCYENIKEDLWISSISGGTDVCTAFITGTPTLSVYAGELQSRALGAKVESFTDKGMPLINDIGELVLTEPLPSMPIYFWGDDGSRMQESYFNMFSGIWRHGDYLKITEKHTCVIYGRSDATINRGGIRIGTSEIYRAIDHVEEVANSLIVDIPREDGDSSVLLFVVIKNDGELTAEMKHVIGKYIKEHCSPRHVPTEVYLVDDLPETLNAKKLEVPIKRILMGERAENVVNIDSLANPEALEYFIEFAKQ